MVETVAKLCYGINYCDQALLYTNVNVSNKKETQSTNQQLLLKNHFCLLPQYPSCMLSTNCEYTCTRVNSLHMEYIAWYIIMFEATYYQLLLLYYNVVVSVLVADQCSFSHKHRARGILQL